MSTNPELSICRRYCCSAFHRYHDAELTDTSDLANSIIPPFSRERYIPEIDYSILRPSLRLATQMLKSGAAALYIVTMVDGDVFLVEEDGKERVAGWEEVDAMRDCRGNVVFPQLTRRAKPEHLDDASNVKQRAAEIINGLAEMIDIDFANLPSDVRGYSKALEGPLSLEMSSRWPRGCRSRISIAANMYIEILKLTSRQRQGVLSNKELERLLLARFSYAVTLSHEIGHSLVCAVQGSIHRGEPFYRDCSIAEAGYSLEAAIFGGLLDGNIAMTTRQYAKEARLCIAAMNRVREGLYVKNALTLTQWPSGIYQHSYHTGHAIMGSRRELVPFDEVARVPLSFIGDLFSDRFWKREATTGNLDPLLVPTNGKWLVGVDTETGRHFVCDLEDQSLEQSARMRLQDIIATENADTRKKEMASLEGKLSPKTSVFLPVAKPNDRSRLRSKRLAAVFGDELCQVTTTSNETSTTIFVSQYRAPAPVAQKRGLHLAGLGYWMYAWRNS